MSYRNMARSSQQKHFAAGGFVFLAVLVLFCLQMQGVRHEGIRSLQETGLLQHSASGPKFCNESLEIFRKHMSPECKELWRDDLFTRPKATNMHYLHMPKAGTSFTTTLRNFMDVCRVKDIACGRGKIPDSDVWCDKKLYSCNGHHYFEPKMIPAVLEEGVSYHSGNTSQEITAIVTMLRDPGRRVVSAKAHDCHAHRGGGGTNMHDIKCSDISVREFAELPFIQNCQTKMLNKFYCAGEVTPERFNVEFAKQNLKLLDFFGITDQWNLSVRMFHCQFGGELRPSEFQNSRPGAYDGEASEDLIEYIRSIEPRDMELYRYAVDLFRKRQACLQCPVDCI
mmetsp:Transcript_7286/g.22196  ORF Transcript_7286/g.22196 Transcript_7286/m.22196 type:complete len:339 (+) Transcript_7286:54-1070(+)